MTVRWRRSTLGTAATGSGAALLRSAEMAASSLRRWSYEIDTDVPPVLGSQLRQYRGVDRVVAKRLFVLLHPEAVEPGRDVHARLPDAVTAARLTLAQSGAVRDCSWLTAVQR
jgi:hypothetical protein